MRQSEQVRNTTETQISFLSVWTAGKKEKSLRLSGF